MSNSVQTGHVENLIKTTQGVCSHCYRVVDAVVFERDGEVFIRKHCSEHGDSEGQVESDPEFFRRHTYRPGLDPLLPLDTTIVPITHRCNIACRFCYVPEIERPDPERTDILERCRDLQGILALGGREPTMRSDLPEIIQDLKAMGKTVVLLTNGLKLGKPDYVKALKESGLDRVVLSIGSLEPCFYEEWEGHNHLDRKLMALDNMRAVNLQGSISATLTRGQNDNQLGPLWRLCLDYADIITSFRVRSSANVVRGETIPRIFLSELVNLVAQAFGIESTELREGYARGSGYRTALSFKAVAHLREGKSGLELDYVDCDPAWYRTDASFDSFYAPTAESNAILVSLASWPDRTNIDLSEGCNTAHVTESHGVLPFYECVVRGENDVSY
ncbi:radical SAM protein [Allochromatium palmeri]|uniref:Radical SAM protein n=1 Tax=Allochromatium palmeri TaxID=231048 RepID=A0A6N8EJK6_9GAMM|nr:radical SAM protein [Allochromatium palmeri]MTW23198.1 radical SAM protein [Allochromatium palmeri]